jgi:transcriptional regulator with XRE-family HTH domain
MNKVKLKIRGRPRRSETELDIEAIGGRIRELRGTVTQEEFAQWLGISQAQLSKYELGQSIPSLDALTKLAKKTGRSTDWILLGRS